MNESNSPQDLITEAMRSIATSEVPEGIESRITVRLRNAASAPHSLWAISSAAHWGLPLAASVALVALSVYMFHPATRTPQPRPQPMTPQNVSAGHAPILSVQPPAQLSTVVQHERRARLHARELASYPAPQQPLTSEEKLLLKCVQQHQSGTMAALSLIASNTASPNADTGEHE